MAQNIKDDRRGGQTAGSGTQVSTYQMNPFWAPLGFLVPALWMGSEPRLPALRPAGPEALAAGLHPAVRGDAPRTLEGAPALFSFCLSWSPFQVGARGKLRGKQSWAVLGLPPERFRWGQIWGTFAKELGLSMFKTFRECAIIPELGTTSSNTLSLKESS